MGVISEGQTPTAEMMQDAITALNVMVESWSAMGLVQYAPTREDFTLVVGDNTYSIGTGAGAGNFDTLRPIRILNCYVRDITGTDYPVEEMGADEYNDLSFKTDAGRPNKLWYNPTYPLGTIFLYPTPDAIETLHIDSEKPLADMTVLTATVNLPSEYLAPLKWCLAETLAPEYPHAVASPGFAVVVNLAEKSFNTIISLNAANKLEPVRLDVFGDRGKGFNIITFQ